MKTVEFVYQFLVAEGIGLVFVLAGVAKVRRFRSFLVTVMAFDVVPVALAGPSAVLVLGVECFAGVFLTLGLWISVAAGALSLSLIAFMLATAWNLVRGRRIDCNCFGGRQEHLIGAGVLLRDCGFLVCTLSLSTMHSPSTTLASWSPLRWMESPTGALGGSAALALWFAVVVFGHKLVGDYVFKRLQLGQTRNR